MWIFALNDIKNNDNNVEKLIFVEWSGFRYDDLLFGILKFESSDPCVLYLSNLVYKITCVPVNCWDDLLH